jgi:hypothetical protein
MAPIMKNLLGATMKSIDFYQNSYNCTKMKTNKKTPFKNIKEHFILQIYNKSAKTRNKT